MFRCPVQPHSATRSKAFSDLSVSNAFLLKSASTVSMTLKQHMSPNPWHVTSWLLENIPTRCQHVGSVAKTQESILHSITNNRITDLWTSKFYSCINAKCKIAMSLKLKECAEHTQCHLHNITPAALLSHCCPLMRGKCEHDLSEGIGTLRSEKRENAGDSDRRRLAWNHDACHHAPQSRLSSKCWTCAMTQLQQRGPLDSVYLV